jgi:hypothetical protein
VRWLLVVPIYAASEKLPLKTYLTSNGLANDDVTPINLP